MSTVRVVLGSDHAGRALRLSVVAYLKQKHFVTADLGSHSSEGVDYPSYAIAVGEQLQAGEADYGILVCGTGLGMSMAANRLRGMRGALCTDPYMAALARSHNDANILCLGERIVGCGLATAIVDAFLTTAFAAGRHVARLDQLRTLEKNRL